MKSLLVKSQLQICQVSHIDYSDPYIELSLPDKKRREREIISDTSPLI